MNTNPFHFIKHLSLLAAAVTVTSNCANARTSVTTDGAHEIRKVQVTDYHAVRL